MQRRDSSRLSLLLLAVMPCPPLPAGRGSDSGETLASARREANAMLDLLRHPRTRLEYPLGANPSLARGPLSALLIPRQALRSLSLIM
jgi:hypothetical protein